MFLFLASSRRLRKPELEIQSSWLASRIKRPVDYTIRVEAPESCRPYYRSSLREQQHLLSVGFYSEWPGVELVVCPAAYYPKVGSHGSLAKSEPFSRTVQCSPNSVDAHILSGFGHGASARNPQPYFASRQCGTESDNKLKVGKANFQLIRWYELRGEVRIRAPRRPAVPSIMVAPARFLNSKELRRHIWVLFQGRVVGPHLRRKHDSLRDLRIERRSFDPYHSDPPRHDGGEGAKSHSSSGSLRTPGCLRIAPVNFGQEIG